jgi:hypothetical protein
MNPLHPPRCKQESSLRAMLAAAYAGDRADRPGSPMGARSVGDTNGSTLFGVVPIALVVLRVAAQIERDPARLMTWYRKTPIAALGHLTAERLVALGQKERVIDFLQSILAGERG